MPRLLRPQHTQRGVDSSTDSTGWEEGQRSLCGRAGPRGEVVSTPEEKEEAAGGGGAQKRKLPEGHSCYVLGVEGGSPVYLD